MWLRMVKNGGFANIRVVAGLSEEGDRRLASRLKEKYKNEIVPVLMEKFKYSNVMQVPKLMKVVLNVSGSEARDNQKVIDAITSDLSKITGQRPVICVAKKSVANFKLRVGMKIGAKVTLRQDKMFEFVDKFFNVALPRVRDFRGISANSFDGRGNYNVGVKEQLIFPEIEYEKIDKVRGMDICFVTTAQTDEEARELLSLMGAPFNKGR
jgi:large subunit ribosomal protein L5